MAKLTIQSTAPGMAQMIREYNLLDDAQKRTVKSALGLGRAQKSIKSPKTGAFKTMAKNMAAAVTVAVIVQKALQGIIHRQELIKKLSKDSATTQQSFNKAFQNMLANIDIAVNKQKQLQVDLLGAGEQFGAGGGARAVEVFTGIKTATGLENKEALALLRDSNIVAKAYDQTLQQQLNSAVATNSIMKSFKGDLKNLPKAVQFVMAREMVKVTAASARVSSENFGRLAEQSSVLANIGGITQSQALALQARGTVALQDITGEKTSTATIDLLRKIVATNKIKFKAEDSFGKLLEFINLLQTGKLEKDKLGKILGTGAEVTKLVFGLDANTLKDLAASIEAKRDPGVQDSAARDLKSMSTNLIGFKEHNTALLAEAKKTNAQLLGPEAKKAAEIEGKQRVFDAILTQQGTSKDSFLGIGLGPGSFIESLALPIAEFLTSREKVLNNRFKMLLLQDTAGGEFKNDRNFKEFNDAIKAGDIGGAARVRVGAGLDTADGLDRFEKGILRTAGFSEGDLKTILQDGIVTNKELKDVLAKIVEALEKDKPNVQRPRVNAEIP